MLRPVSARVFAPYGHASAGDTQEPQLANGNLAIGWRSNRYASAAFEGVIPGIGLLVDMGHAISITKIHLLLGDAPGADFQIRIGNSAHSISDLRPVAYVHNADVEANIEPVRPAHGRFVLIWFTKLPADSSGSFQVTLYSISVMGLD